MTGRCPVCDGPAEQSERYPQALCAECEGRATDLAGRPIWMTNESMSGGFLAFHRDDDTPCDQVTRDFRVLVDGLEYRAGEHRFGGVVVQPLDP